MPLLSPTLQLSGSLCVTPLASSEVRGCRIGNLGASRDALNQAVIGLTTSWFRLFECLNAATETQRPSSLQDKNPNRVISSLIHRSYTSLRWVGWNGIKWLPLIQTNHPLGRFRGMWRSVRCYHLAILLLLLLMRRRGLDQRQQRFICLHSLTADSPRCPCLPGQKQRGRKTAHTDGFYAAVVKS